MNSWKLSVTLTKLTAVITLILVVLTTVPQAVAGKYKVLYQFKGATDGSGPSGLIFDPSGNLYGTTWSGGAHGAGTVFKLDTRGKKVVLYSFTGNLDGANPHVYSNLTIDALGNLFGTTYYGGLLGGGTAFKLDTNGVETVLYNFCYGMSCMNGMYPTAGLVMDEQGNLYGTTLLGGDGYYGTVFELSPNGDGSWSQTMLHSFNFADGAEPYAGLVKGSDDTLYGTTWGGGAYTWGTIFKIDLSGFETVLYNFLGSFGTDGATPYKPPAFDSLGNLYGTAGYGGDPSCPGPFGNGCGTIWKLDLSGNLTIIHAFTGGKDGSTPLSGLLLDSAGNLYGMTSSGGVYGFGVVFQLTPGNDGHFHGRILHSFANRPAANPCSNLIMNGAGKLYGTTQGDGVTTFGSVFEITP